MTLLPDASNSPHLLLEIKCVMIKKLLLCVLAIFSFTFLMSQNTFADVQDIVYTYNSSNASDSHYLCNGSGSCTPYHYLVITGSNFSGSQNYNSFSNACFRVVSGFVYYEYNLSSFCPYRQNTIIISLDNPSDSYDLNSLEIAPGLAGGDFSTMFGSDYTLEFKLTNNPFSSSGSGTINITENGTFDVTNYASAVVNVDQTISDLPPYSELVVDSFWKYHVAIAGGLASIFAIFVVYRIIKSRLR